MPRTVRSLLRVMGSRNDDDSQLLSYLLFESAYTRELMALGRADVVARRDEVEAFLAAAAAGTASRAAFPPSRRTPSGSP